MPGARDGQLHINRGTDSPPWTLGIWDDGAQIWRYLGTYGPDSFLSWAVWDVDGTLLVDSEGNLVVDI